MKYKNFLDQFREYNGGINRGVEVDFSFLSEIKAGEGDVEKVEGFEQICGNIVQKLSIPVDILKVEGRKALFIEVNHGESIEVDLNDVGYICVKVADGISGELNIVGGELNSCLLEGLIGDGAELSLNLDVCNSSTVWVSGIELGEEARLDYRVADLAVEQGYFDIRNYLKGRSAKADVNWVYLSGGIDKKNAYVANYFENKNCNGEIYVRGVQEDKSKVTFLGEINISLDGGGTDSYLKEDIMMLDDTSYVEAIPSLEIKTNDVKAGHGVSIAKISDEKLFYLMARGMEEGVARSLLRQGFLREGYGDFENEEWVDRMDEIVTKSYE